MDGAALRVISSIVVALTVGCVHPTGGRRALCLPCPPGICLWEADLLQRGLIHADVPLLAEEAQSPLLGLPPGGSVYRLMTAEECQCAAAARATTAYLVEAERQLAIASTPLRPGSRMARGLRVHQQVLALRAAQIRNDAAAEALEAFYQLAAAEASAEVVDRTFAHLRRLNEQAMQLERQGLPSPLDRGDLRRREIDLLSRRAELEWTVAHLNGRLRLLVGCEAEPHLRIWPQTDLIVERGPLDAEWAVRTGLASRADLATLRLLTATFEEATLPLVRGALQTQDATLGNVTSGFERLGQLLRPARGEDELRVRRMQLTTLLAEKERELAIGIRSAVGAVAMRRDQAVLAKQAQEIARARLADLAQLREVGQATPFDVAAQEGKALEAEGVLVEKAAAWRLAEVKLRQALGVLAQECADADCFGPAAFVQEVVPAPWRP